MTTNFIFKNHQLLEEKQAQVSINERACLFGDGIFETCKIFDGKIYDFKSHELRIKKGLKALQFSAEISDLEKRSRQLIKKNNIKNGILKISISRGIGSAGYLPTYESKSLIIIQTLPQRKLPSKIALGVSRIKKPSKNSLPVDCKTMQGLPFVLTKIAAKKEGLFDAIMLSQEGFISESSSANIFWIKNGKIYTPSKACDILPGTIRQKLLKISPVKIFEVKAKLSELKKADEIFLTNSSCLIASMDELKLPKFKKTLSNNIANQLLKLLQEDVKKCSK